MSAASESTTAGVPCHHTYPANDIIPPDYTVQSRIPHPNIILTCDNTLIIQRLLHHVDRERHHLGRGLKRLRFQNHWLKKGHDTTVKDSVLRPFDERRWTVEAMVNVKLEVLRNEVIRVYSRVLYLVREQHALRERNKAMREALEARMEEDLSDVTDLTGHTDVADGVEEDSQSP
ncbi:MAG: hypothetical protein Q9216_001713 [Gyalolechia sp. 2 TL-2023]